MQPLNLEKYYEFETLGVQARNCPCPKVAISRQDKEAVELMESSCKLEDGRYTIDLPKEDKSFLPNNYPLAEKRLLSLEINLLKDEAKARMYDEVIMEYEKNGWAHSLTEDEVNANDKPVYHLPHHGVYRPEKKSTPLTVVFDPICQYQGVSLNSFLHKRPCPCIHGAPGHSAKRNFLFADFPVYHGRCMPHCALMNCLNVQSLVSNMIFWYIMYILLYTDQGTIIRCN